MGFLLVRSEEGKLGFTLLMAAECTQEAQHMFVQERPVYTQEELERPVYKQEEPEHIFLMGVPICKLEVRIPKQVLAKAIRHKLVIAVKHIQFSAILEDDKQYFHQHHRHPDTKNLTPFSLEIERIPFDMTNFSLEIIFVSFHLEMVLSPSTYFVSFHKVR